MRTLQQIRNAVKGEPAHQPCRHSPGVAANSQPSAVVSTEKGEPEPDDRILSKLEEWFFDDGVNDFMEV